MERSTYLWLQSYSTIEPPSVCPSVPSRSCPRGYCQRSTRTLSLKAASEPRTPGAADILFSTRSLLSLFAFGHGPELEFFEMSTPLGFKALPLSIKLLSLPVVLKCGQSFRWQKVALETDAEWRLTLRDRVVCLRQTPETLYYRAIFPSGKRDDEGDSTLTWLRDYFQLDIDVLKLFSAVQDPILQSSLNRFDGAIRMLRQDPWENLIS